MDNHPDQLARMKQLNQNKDINLSAPIHEMAGRSTSFPLGMSIFEQKVIEVQKLDPRAIIPTRANKSDAGYDLYALEGLTIPEGSRSLVSTGIAMAIPRGQVGLIWPRSGLAVKSGIDVFAGVVDSGYRGEIKICLYNSSSTPFSIDAGDRVAQILFQEVGDFCLSEVKELDVTDRGHGGFGSSGV